MAADTIQADYEMLEQVTSKFSQQGDEIQQMLQNVRNHMDSLQGEWMGDAADAFNAEMADLILPSGERLHQALVEAGQATQRIGQLISSAEEEARNGFVLLA